MSEPAFDPTSHDFVFLSGFEPAKGVKFFEYRSHESVDGSKNLHRLNYYLSQDRQFVNIWYGCLDSMILDVVFEGNEDLAVGYDEPLFRGYIKSEEQGLHILRALRLGSQPPQLLKKTPEGKVLCESL